jgi:hypothetical protein
MLSACSVCELAVREKGGEMNDLLRADHKDLEEAGKLLGTRRYPSGRPVSTGMAFRGTELMLCRVCRVHAADEAGFDASRFRSAGSRYTVWRVNYFHDHFTTLLAVIDSRLTRCDTVPE